MTCSAPTTARASLPLPSISPVSYTHLDVYKRQIEWSENAADVLPEAYKTVHIAYGDADNDRRITIGEVTV